MFALSSLKCCCCCFLFLFLFLSSFFAPGPVGVAGRERKSIENNDFERRGRSGQPAGSEQVSFLLRKLIKNNDFERRGRSGQAAGSGRERKRIDFIKKVKQKTTILSPGAGRGSWPAAAGSGKVLFLTKKDKYKTL